MGLLSYFKKRKEEKDYLRRLYEKTGVNPSVSKSEGNGKYPSRPLKAERQSKHPTKRSPRIFCPYCGSQEVTSAGYSDRFECHQCGKVFT